MISFELEYIHWPGSSFLEYGVEKSPPFQKNFLGYMHPHLGFSFYIPYWPGLTFKTGFFTEDYFDHLGRNNRQILWSLGISVFPYNNLWKNRLQINFVYVSSSVFSIFWKENNQNEKIPNILCLLL